MRRRWWWALVGVAVTAGTAPAGAQVRGVYPTGMSATNSGVTPASGYTYSNLFIFNERNASKGPEGEVVTTGTNAIMIDLNTVAWVSTKRVLNGARLSATATLLFSNNSLASDTAGPLSAGGGFADFYLQPFILGWDTDRLGVRTAYGVLAPTGRFNAGASDNVGSGYWTHALSAGLTYFPTRSKSTALSVFHMYEFHTVQEGTDIHPGQTGNIDYSVMQTFAVRDAQVQLGLIGYEQWQTTARTGPSITPAQSSTRYLVNSMGGAANISLPDRKLSLGVKYFKEFASRSTYEGHSMHISAAVTF